MNLKKLSIIILLIVTLSLLSIAPVNAVVKNVAFDSEYYVNSYPDLKAAFGNDAEAAYNHFINIGVKEGRVASPVFDPVTYILYYPDLQAAFGTDYAAAYNHFVSTGINEGRLGSAEFNVKAYLANYPDLEEAFGTDYAAAFNHFVTEGVNEGRIADALVPGATVPEDHVHTHDYSVFVEWAKEPTCDEDGLGQYKCSICGELNPEYTEVKKSDEYHVWTNATDENPEGWVIISEGATARKFQERTCAVCEDSEDRSLEEALEDEKTTEIVIDTVESLDIKDDITIPAGKTVKIATKVNLSKGTLTNNGTIVIAADDAITLESGKVMNNGKIEVAPEGKLKASENIINRGTIVVGVNGQIDETDTTSIIGTGKVIFELGTYEDPETSEEKTSSKDEIVAAITSSSATEVKLISDINLSEKVEVKIDGLEKLTKVKDLDLNGYTINSSVNNNDYAIEVDENINLTIKNGSIVSDMTNGRNVNNKGTLTLNKVTMKGNYNVVSGVQGEQKATTLTIIGGEYTAKFCGVYGSSKAKITISGATITSDTYVVSGRGSEKDTTLVIKDNSVITSKNDVAIYMPSTKLLQVVNSKVTGCSGIETAAGNVEITNSQVTATGISSNLSDIHDDGNKETGKPGSVNDRSALLVMSREGYGTAEGSIKVTIKGSTLTSAVDRAIRTHVNGATESAAGNKIGVKTIEVTYDDATVLSGKVVNDKIVPADVTIKVNGVEVGKTA